MKYRVAISVVGRYYVDVETDSISDARRIAEEKYSKADLGELKDVNGVTLYVEDEKKRRIQLI